MNAIAVKLLSAALIFLCISSIGPFALGPLMALDFRNTPLYQNAIYFYLHFQMNGFMLLAALGLFASSYLISEMDKKIKVWLNLFIYSTVPLFLIFTLWTKPASWIWIVALMGVGLNLISWIKLCLYFKKESFQFSFLAKAAIFAATLKIIFQVFICVPAIAEWAFLNRNLIIGYIHLLTLGCIMPLILDQFIRRGFFNGKNLSYINSLFLSGVVIYLLLLFIQPLLALFLIIIPYYQLMLFLISVFLMVIGVLYLLTIKSKNLFNCCV